MPFGTRVVAFHVEPASTASCFIIIIQRLHDVAGVFMEGNVPTILLI
jgi:hypothetical protein